MDPQRSIRPTALVTGASRGIGQEIARQLAREGRDLVIAGRDAAALEALAGELRGLHRIEVRCEVVDLSAPGAAAKLWARLEASGVEIETLVNNAGSGLYGNVHEQDPEALERMLQLNIVALVSLTRLALSGMISRRSGRILNVGSVVGYQPSGPRMAGYYASKAFVNSFSRSLAAELEGTGVTVTNLSPGLTESSFEERSGAARSNLYKYLPRMKASDVAAAGISGLKQSSRSVIPGFAAKLLAFAGELPPRAIAAAVNRFLLAESR